MGYKVIAVDDEEPGNLQFQINLKFQIEPPPPADLCREIEMRLNQQLRGRHDVPNEVAAVIQQVLDQTNQ